MDKITLKEIRALKPCYDPSLHMKEDWEGTLVDFLHIEVIPNHDRIWVAVRLMPRFLVEVFAIDCAFAAYGYATSDASASCSYSASAAASYSADSAAAADATYASSAYATSDASASASHSASCSYSAAYAAASNAYYASSAYHASSTAAAAASSARNQQRENQIDALIMLLEGE